MEREGSGHVGFHYSFFFFFFFLDDSCFPVFRQKQQLLPKHIMDPMDQQAVRPGVGRSTRETRGKGLP